MVGQRGHTRFVPLAIGVAAGFAVVMLGEGRPARAAAVAVTMAVWWFTEALPIAWTACVPLLAYPLLGVHGRGLVGGAGADQKQASADHWPLPVTPAPSRGLPLWSKGGCRIKSGMT